MQKKRLAPLKDGFDSNGTPALNSALSWSFGVFGLREAPAAEQNRPTRSERGMQT